MEILGWHCTKGNFKFRQWVTGVGCKLVQFVVYCVSCVMMSTNIEKNQLFQRRALRGPVRDIAFFFFLKLSRDKLKLSRDKWENFKINRDNRSFYRAISLNYRTIISQFIAEVMNKIDKIRESQIQIGDKHNYRPLSQRTARSCA